MLVSHSHKFIYTKTIKTASTSVESYFERFCMPAGEWEQLSRRNEQISSAGIIGFRGVDMPNKTTWWNHMPAQTIRKQLGEKVWNSYFKFCVIRNPYEKCISAFEHFGKDYQTSKQSILDRICSFFMSTEQRRFYDYLVKAMPSDRDKYIIDGQFCLDDYIRYESLEHEIERLCNRLSLPWEPEYLPTFKMGIRRADSTIDSLYTLPAKRRVQKHFKMEIEYFRYTI